VSENVTPMSETGGCDNVVLFPTLTLLSELGSTVPIRSDDAPFNGPPAVHRGVHWIKECMSLPGERDLVIHSASGRAVCKVNVIDGLADPDLERCLADWYARKVPVEEPARVPAPDEDEDAPAVYPPLRLVH
jgi:hypothetical protein